SGGQKQGLSIALALVGNPEISVLVELTTVLDLQARLDTWHLIDDVRDHVVTILLVTHFMEEAERHCHRLAMSDRGRDVSPDSPSGLVAKVDDEQRIRFRPSETIAEDELLALPEVHSVTKSGSYLVVTGDGNALHAVTSLLARKHIVASELRLEQSTL